MVSIGDKSEINGFKVTVEAPINIALIKYWGKRNEALILPLNDSISISINDLKATTTIVVGPHVFRDLVTVNGKEIPLNENSRFQRVFKEARSKFVQAKQRSSVISLNHVPCPEWNIKVDSTTNFPVAAGLASSAAGFAAIAVGFGRFSNMSEDLIVKLARIGSGSACRSVQCGFVQWHAGNRSNDDLDCRCESLAPDSHWPELCAVVIVLSNAQKAIGSSEGMRFSVETSNLLETRVSENVPKRIEELKNAIREKNFDKLAQITMLESDNLHSVCESTSPPLKYLHDDSRKLIEFVKKFNAHYDTRKVAYTFDAGPNCCFFLEETSRPQLFDSLKKCFDFDLSLLPKNFEYFNAIQFFLGIFPSLKSSEKNDCLNIRCRLNVEKIYYSKVGIGPKVVNFEKIGSGALSFGNLIPAMSGTKMDCKML